ncbi:MAG: hypothetical protein ACXVP0_15680, partial [Bacteroidia bacterium]
MKTIIPTLFFLLQMNGLLNAQVFADSQTSGSSGICGCSIQNAPLATDGNINTASTLNLGIAAGGAKIYQHLSFSITGAAGETVGAVVEDVNQLLLNVSLLNSVSLTTYSNGISNNDTKTSTQFNIRLIIGSTSQYAIEFQATSNFDAVRVELKAGILGAANGLNVYYGYHTVSVLPIELIRFDANVVPGNIGLSWKCNTTGEQSYYTIEKSADAISFVPLTTILSPEKTAGTESYTFNDRHPAKGTSYYKLKSTDKNGHSEDLDILSVNYSETEGSFSVYPNPSKGDLNIICSL